MNDAQRLIRHCGGLTAVAKALGHAHVSTVQGWGERGNIPRWRIYEIRNSPLINDPVVREILERIDPRESSHE